MIPFHCPHCGHFTRVDEKYTGTSGPCVSCGNRVTVPAAVERQGKTGCVIAGAVLGVLLVLGLLALLPLVNVTSKSAKRTSCMNNLRQLTIAVHNYHQVYGMLPPAYVADEQGKPMHSWRVLMLPFVEQAVMYESYRFEEPWNSVNNRAATAVAPSVFQCPEAQGMNSPNTNYLFIVGEGTLFERDNAATFADVKDGLSNTILIVEVGRSDIHWAEPRDLDASNLVLPLVPDRLNQPGSQHDGVFLAAMADGSVHTLPITISPQTLHALISKDGAEVISPDEY